MKQAEVKVGGTYAAKVSGRVVPVRIDGTVERWRGERAVTEWDATNLISGRRIRIRSPQRLRREVYTLREWGRHDDP